MEAKTVIKKINNGHPIVKIYHLRLPTFERNHLKKTTKVTVDILQLFSLSDSIEILFCINFKEQFYGTATTAYIYILLNLYLI